MKITKLYKVVGLVGGGSVINKATPSCLFSFTHGYLCGLALVFPTRWENTHDKFYSIVISLTFQDMARENSIHRSHLIKFTFNINVQLDLGSIIEREVAVIEKCSFKPARFTVRTHATAKLG